MRRNRGGSLLCEEEITEGNRCLFRDVLMKGKEEMKGDPKETKEGHKV